MTDLARRIAALSPAKREQFVHMLLDRGVPLAEVPILPREAPCTTFPTTFAQERLWFLQRMEPRSSAYHLSSVLELPPNFDSQALAQAWTALLTRHESLRTRFPTGEDGMPRQEVLPPRPMPLPEIDLSRLSPAHRSTARRQLRRFFATPFALHAAAPWRLALLRGGRGEGATLFLTVHHILTDGVSMGILQHELRALYAARAGGSAADLPVLPVHYGDFALWQRQWLAGDVLEAQLNYWLERLRGAPPVLELPTDRPRPALQTFRGSRRGVWLSAPRTASLRTLARRYEATPFMVLLAAYQALLGRLAGQRDFCVGTTLSGRHLPQVEGLIGLFMNTLVLRTELTATTSFAQHLDATRRSVLGAFEHQDLPFERLVQALELPRDLSHPPLFQVLLSMQPRGDGGSGGRRQGDGETPVAALYDLNLEIRESGEHIEGWLRFNTDLFDPTTAERLARRFEALLEHVAEEPEQAVLELPLLLPGERHALLAEWNDTAAPDLAVPMHRGIAAREVEDPEAVAVVGRQVHLTRSALGRAVRGLAQRLRAVGVGPGVPVGLLVERGPQLVVGLLGILEAGGAYLPLDPDYPSERLAFLLEDCGAPVVVTGAVSESVVAPLVAGRQRLTLNDLAGEDGPQGPSIPPTELAYVIYTSGSTGRPKGVEISHGALANFLTAMARQPGLNAEDVLLALTSPSFDIAALELFLPLLVGARVEIAEQPGDGAALLRRLNTSRATVVQATPSGWRLLLAAGFTGGGLRALCGGEALAPDLATTLANGCDALWNLYGPTETTVWSTTERLEPHQPVNAGRPIRQTSIHLLDPRFHPVPTGARGELWIGGSGLARGYRRRPSLTAERFVPDPFSQVLGARLYRTGDLARQLGDGRIQVLGRADQQVKVRGHRIELGEIEAALAAHPAIAQAAVVLRHDGGEPRLVAYGVPAGGGEPPTPEALRSDLGQRLPAAMVPALFVPLEALPTTPNGKVDRRALPAPQPVRRTALVAPRNAEEEALAALWGDLLEVEDVGIRDNFFDLGGHSLLLARVQAEIHRRLGVELSIVDLFQYPTIETLARHLRGDEEKATEPDPERLETRRRVRRDRRQARLARRGTHRGSRDD